MIAREHMDTSPTGCSLNDGSNTFSVSNTFFASNTTADLFEEPEVRDWWTHYDFVRGLDEKTWRKSCRKTWYESLRVPRYSQRGKRHRKHWEY